MSNLTDLRAVKMQEASLILAPVLAEIYVKYGLDLTTTLLMYYAAKGIMLSNELTKSDKELKVNQAYKDFNKALSVLDVDKPK